MVWSSSIMPLYGLPWSVTLARCPDATRVPVIPWLSQNERATNQSGAFALFFRLFFRWRGMDLNHQPRAYEHSTAPKNPLVAFGAGRDQRARPIGTYRPPSPLVVRLVAWTMTCPCSRSACFGSDHSLCSCSDRCQVALWLCRRQV